MITTGPVFGEHRTGNNPAFFTDPFGLCKAEDKNHGNRTQADVGTEDITGVGGQRVRSIAVGNALPTVATVGGTIITAGVAAAPLAVADVTAVGTLGGGALAAEAAATGESQVRRLVRRGYPTKLNSAGEPQPWNPVNGRYLSPSVNPGLGLSLSAQVSAGFSQGYANAITGVTMPDPVTNLQAWAQVIGNIVGSIP